MLVRMFLASSRLILICLASSRRDFARSMFVAKTLFASPLRTLSRVDASLSKESSSSPLLCSSNHL